MVDLLLSLWLFFVVVNVASIDDMSHSLCVYVSACARVCVFAEKAIVADSSAPVPSRCSSIVSASRPLQLL